MRTRITPNTNTFYGVQFRGKTHETFRNKNRSQHAPKLKNNKKKKITDAFDDKYIEYEYEGGEELSIEQYLEKVGPYFGNMINNLRTLGK